MAVCFRFADVQRRRQVPVLRLRPRLQPVYSATEWNHAYRDMSRITSCARQKHAQPAAAKLDDEPEPKKEDKKDGPPR